MPYRMAWASGQGGDSILTDGLSFAYAPVYGDAISGERKEEEEEWLLRSCPTSGGPDG